MSEELTETSQSPGYESPGIGAMLQGAASEPSETQPTAETESVPDAPEAEVTSEVAPEPTTEAVPQPVAPVVPAQAVTTAPQITPEVQALIDQRLAESQKGILRALQTERAKRQELEQQLGGAVPADHAASVTQTLQAQYLTLSENAARRHYKDFDQVYGEFLREVGNNDQLRDTVLQSPDPGEAAYQAGLQVKLVRELGPEVISNPYRLLEKGEERGYAKAKAELTKEYELKLSARAGEKQQTPTDISKARSTGGTTVPYRTPSLAEALKKALR